MVVGTSVGFNVNVKNLSLGNYEWKRHKSWFVGEYPELVHRGRRLNCSGYRIRARLIGEIKPSCVRNT